MNKFNFEDKWLWNTFQQLDVRYNTKCHKEIIFVDAEFGSVI